MSDLDICSEPILEDDEIFSNLEDQENENSDESDSNHSSDSDSLNNQEDTLHHDILADNTVCTTDFNSSNYLTKFEIAKIIGVRAEHISRGAKILVDTTEINPLNIAKLEFDEKKIPLLINRRLTQNKNEIWNLNQFN